jgi:4-hydroxy-3-methylbut-2-enyl diphosphate reductase
MRVEIDQKSGFCFGVVNAIRKAEKELEKNGELYSLGQIVHNEMEVERLQKLGLKTINHEEYSKLSNCKVLIRTHGEPPSTYEHARRNKIELIEATCPVVLKLQERVRKAHQNAAENNGQVVIFGHPGHAEVTGLAGQTNGEAIVVDQPDDLQKIDFSRPVEVFSQTTQSLQAFKQLQENLNKLDGEVKTHDTVCRQVSGRIAHLEKFAARFDIIVFVGGKKSSNARVLFEVCQRVNIRTYFVSLPEEISSDWFSEAKSVGICGATSTPQWLMEQVASIITNI